MHELQGDLLSKVRSPPIALEGTVIEDRPYKCPVCANFDTYSKSDMVYDWDPDPI